MTIDDGKEFYRDTTKLMEKHYVIIQRGDPSQHRSQGIVERFNRTLADYILFLYIIILFLFNIHSNIGIVRDIT